MVLLPAQMKILILTKKFPYPLREGEPIAVSKLARSLTEAGCEVTLLVMNTTKHFFEPSLLPPNENFYQAIHAVTVDNRITVRGALASLLAGKSYILSRFESLAFGAELQRLLAEQRFDVVQLETPYLSSYIPVIRQFSAALIAMRAHNVEHEIWERVAFLTKNPLKKWYLRLQNRSLRQFEVENLCQYDLLVAITGRDLSAFRKLGYEGLAVVAPVGFDLKKLAPATADPPRETPSLAFIGALDWMPNQSGVVWFLEEVWPRLAERYPSLRFHVAGKNTPDWLSRRGSDRVVFHGEVPDAQVFIRSHAILVAPLFSGSGIKIKVLEGMALGRAVVTTPIGAEGIPAVHGEHFLLADDAAGFADQVAHCLDNQFFTSKLGEYAVEFVRSNFDNGEIAERVIAAYKLAMNSPK